MESKDLTKKIAAVMAKANESLIGRSDPIKAAFLGLLAQEHVLLIGPPGTAKSKLARKMKQSFDVSSDEYFETLMTKFTTPEEVFGPLSITKLEQDKFERNLEGYLPSVKIAFIDEIFKANSAILNSLLFIINERIYRNGTEIIEVPLLSIVAASNELPTASQTDLSALYDRFLIRQHVDYLQTK